jgi:hypothetical protein
MAMILPPGITGFASLSGTDFGQFKTACYVAARQLGGCVVSCQGYEGGVPRNFNRVTIKVGEETVDILCNCEYPMVAASRLQDDGSTQITFMDVPGLAEAMRGVGPFRVLSAEELASPVNAETLQDLDPAEIEQVKYWKPRTVGEVVFNFWD